MTELLATVSVSSTDWFSRAREIRVRSSAPPEVAESVQEIVEEVRRGGDAALLKYAKELDGAEFEKGNLLVSRSEVDAAVRTQPPRVIRALRASLNRIRSVQGSVLRTASASTGHLGFAVRVTPHPLPSVGCYVPGGRASYASTVLMTGGVAKLAGVGRVALCTPAGAQGKVNPAILAAAAVADVDEVYRVGGAQAIAALAYGTESIPRVEKIVGPGGHYVSAAKRYVSRDVSVDFYAGPTEIVVLADESCDPAVAGWELIGQAEHGEETLCGLVTFSEEYAASVRREVTRLLPGLERRNFIEASLARGFTAVCPDEDTAFRFTDALAPEHLAVMTRNPSRAESKIHGAGLKLLGQYSPCAASDYLVGTDHVIPTTGLASTRGPLSVLDFMKLEWSVTGSATGLKSLLPALKTLTDGEGLPNHYLSARSRFRRRP